MAPAAITWRWNTGWIAPHSTASAVKRYAVPIRTPTATPRAASGAVSAAAMAEERSSWMPPASSTWKSPAVPGARAT